MIKRKTVTNLAESLSKKAMHVHDLIIFHLSFALRFATDLANLVASCALEQAGLLQLTYEQRITKIAFCGRKKNAKINLLELST